MSAFRLVAMVSLECCVLDLDVTALALMVTLGLAAVLSRYLFEKLLIDIGHRVKYGT